MLDELNGRACDAVLVTTNSAARLQQLEQENLFLVPLDRERSRYRYHAAFRDLLLAEPGTRLVHAGGSAPRRASQWYEEVGESERAMEHALRSGDTSWTVRLLAKVAQDFHVLGRVDTVRRWFEEVAGDAVVGSPPRRCSGAGRRRLR